MRNRGSSPDIAPVAIADVHEMARVVLARKDFREFLRYVYVRGDNPTRPSSIPMEEWDYQLERADAWTDGQSEIVLKARQLGFSWLLAAYKLWRAMYWGWSVGYWSIDEPAAVYQLEDRMLYIWERLPDSLKVPYRRRDRRIWFDTGGAVAGHAATQTGGVSYTYQLVVFDEMAFHREGRANWSAVEPTISAGGQAIICSTANPEMGGTGFYYEMWRDSTEGNTFFVPVFVPWWVRPGRDHAWLEQRRRGHKGAPESFDAYYPNTPGDAFVGRSGLVFPNFSYEKHVRLSDPRRWAEYDIRAAGIDPGGGDPTAITIWGIYRDKGRADYMYHQPEGGELWSRRALGVEEMVDYLRKWPGLHGVYLDTAGGASLLQSLKHFGYRAYPALKDRAYGLGLYSSLLQKQNITHHISNKKSIEEYANYRWLERVNPTDKNRYKTSSPVGEHGDCKDTARYVIAGVGKALYHKGSTRGLRKLRIGWS